MYPEGVEPSASSFGKDVAVPTTIEGWAALQGVEPVIDYDAFVGHPSPEDETDAEFALMLRQWRSEGNSQSPAR